MHRYLRLLLAASAVILLLVACADTGDTGVTAATTANGDHADHADFAFGEPAAAAEADRTVEIIATDDFRFGPESLIVESGETILFRIVNEGRLTHDFTLGDEAAQQQHREEMANLGGAEMHDESNAIVLAAGETKELTWTFTNDGTVLFGCHQPGHYEAGMRGEITVGR